MDSHKLKWEQEMLRKRYDRLSRSDPLHLHTSLLQFWNYLHDKPLLAGILRKLQAEAPKYSEELEELIKNRILKKFAHETDVSNFALRVIEHCAQFSVEGHGEGEIQPELRLFEMPQGSMQEQHNWFCFNFLQPLYEVFAESLDQQRVILYLLTKYKKKVEWFEREQALQLNRPEFCR